MTTTFPYISFPGNAAEVFSYYQSIFGGELTVMTYGDLLDNGAEFPFDAPRDAVAHGTLVGTFNLTGGDDFSKDSSSIARGDISFMIDAADTDEAKQLIDALTADGGKVTMPFDQAPWGGYFGQCEDKYAIAWNVSVDG
ncbi:VOC family protein [Corynebacterium sanguinis]|uniref:VOC family protein n=1 Tax=Corynebacterium sanguinis TaxID=2594913 RepID=A0A838WNN4_9CORY|nr:VOC family protein [Corynebacterium sanguinis]MBA4504696.1 VOC family protein [Corynebacterium sanguinis]MCT1412345.1 VOC family protein [Corynebacterium sanguinis]MCT1413960.1 VOC family protein [Corynebacterium sanguinis]MCT1492026.1 VOC family protein [Corynebacterium sanguinis]MCT1627749.1 VOC family protein [Corynebacterium sanguinis]